MVVSGVGKLSKPKSVPEMISLKLSETMLSVKIMMDLSEGVADGKN